MFTVAGRTALLDSLIAAARVDEHIAAAALVGSIAREKQDAWSDIDLALRLRPGLHPLDGAAAWTSLVHRLAPTAAELDVWSGPALYRVFLLADSLQLDLSFWPHDSFRSTGEPFRLVFGTALEPEPPHPASPTDLIGLGWLHGLHARSAIARARSWQALEMINGLRTQLVALACVRHGLPTHQGRGVDRLPAGDREALLVTVPAGVDAESLVRALRGALDLLHAEALLVDPALAMRLRPPLDVLRETARRPRAV